MGIFDRIAAKATPYEDDAEYETYDQYSDENYYEDETEVAPAFDSIDA